METVRRCGGRISRSTRACWSTASTTVLTMSSSCATLSQKSCALDDNCRALLNFSESSTRTRYDCGDGGGRGTFGRQLTAARWDETRRARGGWGRVTRARRDERPRDGGEGGRRAHLVERHRAFVRHRRRAGAPPRCRAGPNGPGKKTSRSSVVVIVDDEETSCVFSSPAAGRVCTHFGRRGSRPRAPWMPARSHPPRRSRSSPPPPARRCPTRALTRWIARARSWTGSPRRAPRCVHHTRRRARPLRGGLPRPLPRTPLTTAPSPPIPRAGAPEPPRRTRAGRARRGRSPDAEAAKGVSERRARPLFSRHRVDARARRRRRKSGREAPRRARRAYESHARPFNHAPLLPLPSPRLVLTVPRRTRTTPPPRSR